MKRLFVSTCMSMIVFASCSKERLAGSGSIQTENRTLVGFSKIEVEGTTDLTIYQGANFNVSVKAFSNLLPKLETKVVGDVLKIGYQDGVQVSNDNSEVIITLPQLTQLLTNGDSKVVLQNGTGNNLKASIVGTSSIQAYGYTVQRAELSIEGNGMMEFFVTDELDATIVGTGIIYYKGNPSSVSSDITGTGKLVRQ